MRAVLLLLLCACGNALYSHARVRAGQAPRLEGPPPATKAEALLRLGPPLEALPGQAGDLFLWRLRRSDVRAWSLNTGWFSGVAVPVWADVDGEHRDVVLLLAFDAAGRVVERSLTGAAP